MKAKLVTRCGCSKYIDVIQPFPDSIIIPLLPRLTEHNIINRTFVRDTMHTKYDPINGEPIEITYIEQ